eukprot:TRINITY_DN19064_c0_g1_i1.p1 TRINITY_DN19064_c0_g1~~TRINITY_DN19064_c0_g1_i1.p1  ORF type:complete len:191 (-),score=35.03 TRINITY_DN19064_c0_g1_i1:306-878(-)
MSTELLLRDGGNVKSSSVAVDVLVLNISPDVLQQSNWTDFQKWSFYFNNSWKSMAPIFAAWFFGVIFLFLRMPIPILFLEVLVISSVAVFFVVPRIRWNHFRLLLNFENLYLLGLNIICLGLEVLLLHYVEKEQDRQWAILGILTLIISLFLFFLEICDAFLTFLFLVFGLWIVVLTALIAILSRDPCSC